MLDLKFDKKSKKFLSRCEEELYERLIKKIKVLQENPFPSDCKRVLDRKEKTFRIRVGDYRILYCVFKKENLLFISDIDKRPRVFDK